MKPVFAVLAGFAAYFIWMFFDTLFRSGFSNPKALFGMIFGAVVCGGYFVAELRRMMRATESEFEGEKKWVESVVRLGMSVRDASAMLRTRFEAKQETTGFSMLRGVTKVHDFCSAYSEVRLIAKRDVVISMRIEVLYAKKA